MATLVAAAGARRKVSWTRLERGHHVVTVLSAAAFAAFLVAHGLW